MIYDVKEESLTLTSAIDAALARAVAAEQKAAELDRHMYRHAVALLKKCNITREQADDLMDWLMALDIRRRA